MSGRFDLRGKMEYSKFENDDEGSIVDEDEDEDDEDFEEDHFKCTLSESERTKVKEKPKWDSFEHKPEESESLSMADTTVMDVSISVVKLFAYLITFCGVLFGATFSKIITLLMTSQLTPGKITVINKGSLYLELMLPDKEKFLWIWALLVTFAVPEVVTFMRSLRFYVFKGYTTKKVSVHDERLMFIVAATMEILHVSGMALFIFEVLPQLDSVKGAMLTNCVCLVPALLSALSSSGTEHFHKKKFGMCVVVVLFQLTGFFLWPAIDGSSGRSWVLPPTLFLISCGWWMNFVFDDSRWAIIRILNDVKNSLKSDEYNTLMYKHYIWISQLKIAMFVIFACLIIHFQDMSVADFFEGVHYLFGRNLTMTAVEIELDSQSPLMYRYTTAVHSIESIGSDVWWIIGVQILSSYLCYAFAKFACFIMISSFSFALPVIFVVPTVIGILVTMTGYRNEDPSIFNSFLSSYVFFNTPPVYKMEDIFVFEFGWVWILWLISQTLITYHIWFPKCDRLSNAEKLFATPMYSGLLVDQSIVLNRRRDKLETKQKQRARYTPHIVACVTMWHETKPEILEMLKSILRMDQDQCCRKSARENLKEQDDEEDNSYTLESHIFFDDAFQYKDKDIKKPIVNGYVRDLIECMNTALQKVYESSGITIRPPEKYVTPYGGRLTYVLPGRSVLYVHLKNKDKIRHKKRWSQVMYMYYLLGYKLMDLPEEEKLKKAENIFLLALDGDIDFKPQAVLLLVDLMRKNSLLGAACGRIHPLGSGLMYWYQVFEYAIGHWLQKATEHTIGCVLCSPGCFSLFRGSGLMAPNVAKKYTTMAEEAVQYVQYDQGEDRWLCTLLLQQGYRVEYSAASDAFTHCPESFNEFYNQRRRWIPSTMANIIDLLTDFKHIIKINNNISHMYIAYQLMLMVGTILGPGTIFLLLVSAFNAAFKIDNWTAFYYNMIPILLYGIVCLTMSQKIQLLVALILSGIYALIMMAVLVGILMQIQDDGILAPSSLFFFIVAGEIFVAGMVHPREFMCLLCGPIYYVTIPSMYLLLIIYSVCNLNVVSWGTREVKEEPKPETAEQQKKREEEQKKKKNSLHGILTSLADRKKDEQEKTGAFEFSFSSLFKCMLFTHKKEDPVRENLSAMNDTLALVTKKLDKIEKSIEFKQPPSAFRRMSEFAESMPNQPANIVAKVDEEVKTEVKEEENKKDPEERDDLVNPYWLEDDVLKTSKPVVLDTNEIQFWNELIAEYLYPLDKDEKKEKKTNENLKGLRDQMVLTFFMLNALFVVVVFLLQMNKNTVFINWPLDAKVNMTVDANKGITITKTYLQLEPVGVLFILFFALVLVIQFVAMFFHRFETLCHLLSGSSIILPWYKKIKTFDQEVQDGKKKLLQEHTKEKREDSLDAKVDRIYKTRKFIKDREKEEREESKRNSILYKLPSRSAPKQYKGSELQSVPE